MSPIIDKQKLKKIKTFEECFPEGPNIGMGCREEDERFSNFNIGKKLLNNGLSPDDYNNYGTTLFSLVCLYGYKKMVQYMISKGADINKIIDVDYITTPLIEACIGGFSDIVTMLLDNGANPNIRSQGFTPLIIVCGGFDERANIYPAIAKILITRGLSDINAKSDNGHTAFAYLCYEGDENDDDVLEVIQLFINYGADINERDNNSTLLSHCINRNKNKIASILIKNGAIV
jgi:ankyrin repeat protein